MIAFRLILQQYLPIFYHVLPHPPIPISEVIIPKPSSEPKSTHGACAGIEKHKTVHTLACLAPLQDTMH